MTFPPAVSKDLIAGGISLLLTLMVLSYLVHDNPLFRVAVYIFVGVSAGYAASVAWWQVLWPQLFLPLLHSNSLGDRLVLVFPLLLGVLFLMKISPRTSQLGNPSMAYLVGVGAAVAISGAIMGTIFPQTQATFSLPSLASITSDISTVASGQNPSTVNLERFLDGVVIILGTITTLVYFHFGAKATAAGPRRNKLVNLLGWIGQVFIAITFGVLFAGALTAAMTALIERLSSIVSFFTSL